MKFFQKNIEGHVQELIFNRPEVHNAFNDDFIDQLIDEFENISQKVRLLIIRGNGKSFCAGADLNWMKKMKEYSEEENYKDSLKLAKLFESLNSVSIPVLTIAHGYTLGGGTGLLACSDYVIAQESAKFGFTEVKLGLAPCVISPYLIKKIGESNARAYFLSGARFDALNAKAMNLIHEICSKEKLEKRIEELKSSFLNAAPAAQVSSKRLIFDVLDSLNEESMERTKHMTARTISRMRTENEAQLGMNAILKKEKINWKEHGK